MENRRRAGGEWLVKRWAMERNARALPMPVAYEIAVTALGEGTNQFHCVGANVSTELSEAGWKFTFFSTNAAVLPKSFYVVFDGKAYEDDGWVPQ